MFRKFGIGVLLMISVIFHSMIPTEAVEIQAPYGILMEVTTGTILYEREARTITAPASITKIMTLLLIFDALEEGKIQKEDQVTVSEYAASMGGSQVFLEQGEVQTVDTMIKCIAVASANDACVAMAEYLAGSEESFVEQMNQRAKKLGMENTHFVNCCGLDTEGHETCAYDVALMSRELLNTYPEIHEYCTIWMENITHETVRGSSEFGLANTNKLIRQYEYATGLKTGSTNEAGFCVSASAKKDGVELIAVIMKGETGKSRFADACVLLNYGFANCRLYEDQGEGEVLPKITIKKGKEDQVEIRYQDGFSYVLTDQQEPESIEKKIVLLENLEAPVKEGTKAGQVEYYLDHKKIGTQDLVTCKAIEKARYRDYLERVWLAWKM